HACCVTFLSERDVADKPEWTQRVTNALVQAQAWVRDHRAQTAQLMSNSGSGKYTPHTQKTLEKVLVASDFDSYEKSGVIRHVDWNQRRIDFQPYPYPSYTERLVQAMKGTKVEGNDAFLQQLDPAFVARDLVDDCFVRAAIDEAGGPSL